jgi:hypothetical protein
MKQAMTLPTERGRNRSAWPRRWLRAQSVRAQGSTRAITYALLIAILSQEQCGRGEVLSGICVGAVGWSEDMAVPPTPTPIKSGWWRRGRSQGGEDDSSSPGFRAPSSPDSGSRGRPDGGLPHNMGSPFRDSGRHGAGAGNEDEPMQSVSPRSEHAGGHHRGSVPRFADARPPPQPAERSIQDVRTARLLPFTPSPIPPGDYGSDYASRRAVGPSGAPKAPGEAHRDNMARFGDEREYERSGAGLGGEWPEGGVTKGTVESGLPLPKVVSWERTRDLSVGRRRHSSPPRRLPAQQGARARSLSRERERGDCVFAGTPLREGSGAWARGYLERRENSPPLPPSVGAGGRVNAFALSPMSPLAGLPRGITSAGVGKMTRRLTMSKSFLRDYFNVEALARGEHGELCVRQQALKP